MSERREPVDMAEVAEMRRQDELAEVAYEEFVSMPTEWRRFRTEMSKCLQKLRHPRNEDRHPRNEDGTLAACGPDCPYGWCEGSRDE